MFADENLMVEDLAVRQRLNSFKLGKAIPLSNPIAGYRSGHRHQRSHSRNTSMSSSTSLALSLSSSRSSGLHDLSSFSFGSMFSSVGSSASATSSLASSVAAASPAGPPSKRNSHHRRLSSVSTRRESAELMGVSLPELPPVSSDDNINLGEKDSIRRRALWALEGKPDVSFSKVEIPELSTPEVEKIMFDFSTKPSGGSFGNLVMGNKRDSFKLLPPSGSTKDQLGTLLEEEEEEEEIQSAGQNDPRASLPSPTVSSESDHSAPSVTPVLALTKPTLPRPRPATLNLRPLSLTPENLGSATCQGLPTPSLTPSPRSGLRSLSLSPASDESPLISLSHASRSFPIVTAPTRRPLLNRSMDSASDSSVCQDDPHSMRRSSISYRSSSFANVSSSGLPTPEATPTMSRRASVSESIRSSKSGDDEFFPVQASYRPLSASEQHFLYKSHNALLARITDLEKALSVRRRSIGGYSITGGSRPSSMISDVSLPSEFGIFSGVIPGEPSDEMLALIGDLKAERDELKKDVDGWRTRVADLDKQLVLVAKRVENERREAWVARSRVGLLEAEKGALDKRLESLDQVVAALEAEKSDLEKQNRLLKEEGEVKAKRVEALEVELQRVKQELEGEWQTKELQAAAYENGGDPMATPTPQTFDGQARWRQGLAFSSMDSGADIEDGRLFNFGFPLKTTEDAIEDEDGYFDEEDGLAGYEDEEESDPELETSSSFGSLHDFSERVVAPPIPPFTPKLDGIKIGPDVVTATPSNPLHRSRHSLSRVWTFPKAKPASGPDIRGHKFTESVDKFFGCLDGSDTSDDSEPITPMPFDYEESKGLFASGFKYADNDDAPFYLPGGVGTVVEEVESELKNRKLSAVAEEKEGDENDKLSDMDEDEDMFGEIGGIRIIFTPPDDVEEEKGVEQMLFASTKLVSSPPTLPAFDFGTDEAEDRAKEAVVAFTFAAETGVSREPEERPTLKLTAGSLPPRHTMITPPSSLPRSASPRASSPGSAIPRPTSRTMSPLAKSGSSPPSVYATPPSKRGGVMPSFIPQAISSPSPSKSMSVYRPKNAIPGPTFIRPPGLSKPLTPLTPNISISKPSTTTSENEQPSMNQPLFRSSDNHSQVATAAKSRKQCSASETNMKSVDLRHAPQFLPSRPLHSPAETRTTQPGPSTQPISSILISSFSNFIPLSWSSRRSFEPTPFTQAGYAIPSPDRKPAFISRERQLLKLKRRMEIEGTTSVILLSTHCRRCDVAALVNL